MRARFAPTQKVGFKFGRQLVAVAFAAVLAFATQVASAYEITTWSIEEVGSEVWLLTGNVDVDEENGETATIDFGGVLAGQSTTTDTYGDFTYTFNASYGSEYSFTGTVGNETTQTIVDTLFDPNGE